MRVFVAMSGGVDSSVAALLLERAGHEVVGIHLRTGVKAGPELPGARPRCCGTGEAEDARRVCARLQIPFYVQNTETEFAGLMEAFADAYAAGRTPNPCIACNSRIKFGALLARARALGADAVATGHYARRVEHRGRWAVARARDARKDQSYVLYELGPEELEAIRFPLGELEKSEVRALAREAGFGVADKRESQEICFVPSGNYRDLVRSRRPDAFRPGEIVDGSGRVLGAHDGVGGFTVGQRKGLGLSSAKPLFVTRIDFRTREVVVAPREELGLREAQLEAVRWTAIDPPAEPFEADVRLRYQAQPLRAVVEPLAERGRIRLRFENPAWPVTPGQAAVLYDDDVVLGGGRIRACS